MTCAVCSEPSAAVHVSGDTYIHPKCSAEYYELMMDSGKGPIVGICNACGKPVREKESYRLSRKAASVFLGITTFPKSTDDLLFRHWICDNETLLGGTK